MLQIRYSYFCIALLRSSASVPKLCIYVLLALVVVLRCEWNIAQKHVLYEQIHVAVSNGHRELAAELMEELKQTGQTNFNFLHHDVSTYVLLSPLRTACYQMYMLNIFDSFAI